MFLGVLGFLVNTFWVFLLFSGFLFVGGGLGFGVDRVLRVLGKGFRI